MRGLALILAAALAVACGGEAVIDGDPLGEGGGGCPSGLVGEQTPCDQPGLVCEGVGDDDLCGDWTCACGDSGTFDCSPGLCQ